MKAIGTAALLLLCCVSAPAEISFTNIPAKVDPTSAYREQKIQGWRILVNEKLLADTNLCARALKLMDAQLYQITRVVPAGPLEKLRQIPIWMELSSQQFPCACYHESREWLSTHGVNPEKTGAVEIANADTFLKWTTEQPWMVLHELAHGYHHKFLGHNNADILRCFEKAKASKTYDSVMQVRGHQQRHYALNNEKEYFAEATEAYFGTNDFYPFVRGELKAHDPEMFAALGRLWEVTGDSVRR